MPQNNTLVLYSIIILLLTVLVYAPGLAGGFVYDDYHNFLHNKAITDAEFTLQGMWSAMQSSTAGPLGRPLPMLSFFLNYHLSGHNPFSYKLFNILIHSINAVLVFFVSYSLFKAYFRRIEANIRPAQYRLMAMWVALLWAVHPINLTAVLYVVQRMTSMAGTFTLLGILTYGLLREGNRLKATYGYLGLILVFGVLAALCKENGVLLFLFLFVIESFIYRWRFKNTAQKKPIVAFFSTVFIGAVIIVGYLLLANKLTFDYSGRGFTLPERLLTQARAIWFYVAQILLPQAPLFGLYHDDFLLSVGLFEPVSTFWSVAGLGLLVLVALATARKMPWLGFGVFFFLVGHLLESTIIALNLVHEHRNYIPSLGLIILLVVFFQWLLHKRGRMQANILLVILTCLFALVTVGRAYDWGNLHRYAKMSMQRQPNSVSTNYGAGFIFQQFFHQTNDEQYLTQSINALQKADAISGDNMQSAIALLHIYATVGKPPEQALINKIKSSFSSKQITVKELMALSKLVNCKLEGLCAVDDDILHGLFNSLISNPLLHGRGRDEALYFYAEFLGGVANEGENALSIAYDIVNRNPDVLEYKIQLITLLFSNGKNDEAERMMTELSNEHGFKFEVVKK